MRVLFLTQIVPYPPDSGPKVKTWNVLRYLVESGHDLILATYMRKEEEANLSVLQKLCCEVHPVLIKRSRVKDFLYGLKSQMSGRPFLIERDDLPEMRSLIKEIIQKQQIDAIHADQLTMTQFALNRDETSKTKPFTVFDSHNAVWNILERSQNNITPILRPLLKLETQRVKRYEGMVVQEFDHTLVVTDFDRQDLMEARKSHLANSKNSRTNTSSFPEPKYSVIPITVDTEKLQPIVRQPGSRNIITLGTLHYPPNADGIRWFVNEIYPVIYQVIPDVTLTIVGKNPPRDLSNLADSDPRHFRVTGYVPELEPYLKQSALMVVPVRVGSGMRVRILEAFARAMPVVTTTVGLEGIEATPGSDIMVADHPSEFANSVIELLENEELQTQLAMNSRQIAEERYEWRKRLVDLKKIFVNQDSP
jgi:glycosyltransferase involved in cell wall biosynthesis